MSDKRQREYSYERAYFEDVEGGVHRALDEKIERTPEQQILLDQIRELEAEVDDRPSGSERVKYRDQRLFEIMSEHHLSNADRHAALAEDAEKVRTKYIERMAKPEEVARTELDLRRAELEYGALDPEALQEKARKIITEGRPMTRDRLLVLNAALKAANIEKITVGEPARSQPFLTWVEERGLDHSWENDRPEVFKALRLYDTRFGQTIVLDSQHGGLTTMDISKIYQGK